MYPGQEISAFTLEDEPYLRKLGVMGVLSGAVFRTSVLTIDMQQSGQVDHIQIGRAHV